MKNLIYIVLFLFFVSKLQAQLNLVPNWSFETYTACPNAASSLPGASPWTAPTANSSEYFNACAVPPYNVPYCGASFQYAKNGNGFAGLWIVNGPGLNYREYAQVALTSTLIAGGCYYGEFYVNLHNKIKYACNNLAASFSNSANTTTAQVGFSVLNLPPHIINYNNPVVADTLNWVKVSGLYTAAGGEAYITIGNFKDDANTDTLDTGHGTYQGAYYHLDAVSVFSVNPNGVLPWVYNDTTIFSGDSVYIGTQMGGTFASSWYLQNGGFIKNGPGLYVKPAVSSNYIVQFTVCGVPRADTVHVTVQLPTRLGSSGTNSAELSVKPNPNHGLISIEVLDEGLLPLNSVVKIYDLLGREIKRVELIAKKQDLPLYDLKTGVYYLQLIREGKPMLTKKIIKD